MASLGEWRLSMNILGFMPMFDPMYFLFVGPAILLAIWAESRVRSAYQEGSRFTARCGLSGAQAAQAILDRCGITNVSIEPVKSFLGDHYDPRKKVLRLSPDVYNGRSLAALGIAAHEVGHAIQDAQNYGPLVVRNGLVPLASTGSYLSVLLVTLGIIFAALKPLALIGLGLFAVVVLFQVVNLPVEFNASRSARLILLNNGMVTQEEDRVVGKVLNAAAMTYVAATVTALMQLLYLASIVMGRRD